MSTPSRHPTTALPPHPAGEDLSAPATQVVRDRDAYLGTGRDVGRRLTEEQFELFVAGDVAEALQRELQRLRPRYIALHDVGTSTGLKLLQAMAQTTASKVLSLAVRRQGHGVALATVQFVEVVASDGATIRAYSSDIDADTHSRHEIARVLLANATLGVLVFGDLPSHALKQAVQPLLDALGSAERWRTREVLLLPLGAPALLSPYAAAFISGGVHARVAAQSPRATEAWQQIGSAWHRLHHGGADPPGAVAATAPAAPAPLEQRVAASDDAEAPTEPMGLRDRGGKPAAPPPGVWVDYVNRCVAIKGMVSCCVFDRSSGRVLAHAGGRPPAELLRTLGERLLVEASEVGAMLGTGAEVADLQVTYAGQHVLVHALPKHRGIVLHAVLDATHGNALVARAQLQRFDPA